MIWVAAVVMFLLAILITLFPLRRRVARSILDSNTANVAVLKDQLQELQADYASGIITQAQYDRAREDLQAAVAVDLVDEVRPQSSMSDRSRGQLAILLVVVVGAGSMLMYQFTTTYQPESQAVASSSTNGGVAGDSAEQMPPIDEMVDVLAARLRQNPEDARGWYMLGKSYMLLNRVEEAVGAYDSAYLIIGDKDADLLADYAEALAYVNGDSMLGRPSGLVNIALKLDPQHAKSLWLAGFAAMQNDAYVAAIYHWRGLVGNPAVPEETRQLAQEYIRDAQRLAGLPTVNGETSGNDDLSSVSVLVEVSLHESLKDKVTAEEVIYVFAKASEGPPMPLAVQRLTVADLPTTITLDDSMAMMKGNTLSSYARVIVGARVSRGGTPMAQPGDLQGLGGVINPRETGQQTIIINQAVE